MTFYFYRSHVNADGQWVYKNAAGQEVLAGNGYYDPKDGSIHIDLNAGDEGSAMLSTIAHELTHFIQDWSPEKYRTFCRILMEGYSDRGQSVKELVLAKQAKYRQELGIELTYEQAYDEVIASSMESVLNDGNVMDLLDQLETADKSLWEKFCSFLEEIADLIHRTVQAFRNVHPESDEGRIVERMTEIHAQLQQAFAEGLHEGGENYRTGGKENTADNSGVKHAIVALTDGSVYVQASRNIITGTSVAEQRRNITDFFKDLLDGKFSLDIPTLEGDVLTITKKDTASKARDNYRMVDGHPVKMTADEFAVKLRIEAHIDEIAEISKAPKNKGKKADSKDHPFAKGGFTYRTAYFKDFDGQYYEVTLSIGHSDQVATVYNVGKVEESVLPSAKIIAVVGSKPLGKTLSKNSIREKASPVKPKFNDVTETQQFRKWFGDWLKHPKTASKIINNDGTPKIMYHGSPAQFTIFDKKKAKYSGQYGRGFYFTDSRSHAGTYGQQYSVYLNIRNPLQHGKGTVSREQVRTFLEAVAENEDYSIENYGTYDVDSILQTVMGEKQSVDAFQLIQDINVTAIGDMVEATELFNQVNGTKYDGIVAATETVAFYPEQIKSATDNIGTFDGSNPDIRYSARYQQNASAAQLLREENAGMTEDVAGLTPLVQALRKMNGGKMRTAYLAML